VNTVQACITWACSKLSQSDTPNLDAECIIIFVTGWHRSEVLMWPDKILTEEQVKVFKALVERRSQGEPVAYLTGEKAFWNFNLKVTPHTLIPRPETETLVEFVLDRCPSNLPLKLLDLGTGTGAIALAIARERLSWQVLATDISQTALQIARDNAVSNTLTNVSFQLVRYFEGLEEKSFDVICSNPPYLATGDAHLLGSIRYEPLSALVSGPTGLECLDVIVKEAPQYLVSGGWLVLEHGYNQAEAVLAMFEHAFDRTEQCFDLSGTIRVTAGRLR
jgi:release factor glutamine methyltransferase